MAARAKVLNKYMMYQRVKKYKGDARYVGTVVSVYFTTKRKLRYVVDVEPQGFQMIVSEAQIRAARDGSGNNSRVRRQRKSRATVS